MSQLDTIWIAGYLSAKVNFTIRTVGQYQSFSVTIHEKRADVELVKQIKKQIGDIGTLTARGNNSFRWSIHKQKEVEYFCSTFQPLLQGQAKEKCSDFMNSLDNHFKRLLRHITVTA